MQKVAGQDLQLAITSAIPQGPAFQVGSCMSAVTALCMQQLNTYIVEDSKVIRDSLIAALEEMTPVRVVGVAEDEPTAVHWLAEPGNSAELVIVDIFLKLGSGLGVLRSNGRAPQQRTMVVLSNHATPEIRRKCLELGASRIFDKSNELDALVLYCERLARGEPADSVRGDLD
jgi:DNA-binding NarL/FixJ family response regulator